MIPNVGYPLISLSLHYDEQENKMRRIGRIVERNDTAYKEWEDRLERTATITSSLEAEQDSGNINRTQSMATLNETFPQGTDSGSGPRYALNESPTIHVSLIEQFWQTAFASTLENKDMEITTTIDGKVKVVSESSIRRHLKLEDSDGINTLPALENFKQLALIGIMPPRRFKKKSVKRIVEKRVAKAIEEYEKTRTDSNNAGGSGSANTGGTVAPEMHGCSYKTFTNGKPHSFNGTEGVVGLKRWFEKMEQVFEICKCAEDDKIPWSNVKAMMTTEYCPATEIQRMEQELWTLTLKGDDIEATTIALHELAKALRIGDSNKRKWEDQQGNNYHQQQNQRQEAAKVYVHPKLRCSGHRFSPNTTSAVYEKTSPRSDLRWKPTGRIFESVGLRWIPTRKLFESCASKVDSEPPHGSNVDIPHIHACKQTMDVSAGTSINVQNEQSLDLSAGTVCNVNKENLRVWLLKRLISQKPLSKWIHK
ncbi:hypothetical protein Tco_0966175 [Tanacetum coccineum]